MTYEPDNAALAAINTSVQYLCGMSQNPHIEMRWLEQWFEKNGRSFIDNVSGHPGPILTTVAKRKLTAKKTDCGPVMIAQIDWNVVSGQGPLVSVNCSNRHLPGLAIETIKTWPGLTRLEFAFNVEQWQLLVMNTLVRQLYGAQSAGWARERACHLRAAEQIIKCCYPEIPLEKFQHRISSLNNIVDAGLTPADVQVFTQWMKQFINKKKTVDTTLPTELSL